MPTKSWAPHSKQALGGEWFRPFCSRPRVGSSKGPKPVVMRGPERVLPWRPVFFFCCFEQIFQKTIKYFAITVPPIWAIYAPFICHKCPAHLSCKCPTHLSCKCPTHLSCKCPTHLSHKCPAHLSCKCPTHLSCKCPTHLSHKCAIHLSHKCPIPISHHVLNFTLYICVKFSHYEHWCASGVGAPPLDTQLLAWFLVLRRVPSAPRTRLSMSQQILETTEWWQIGFHSCYVGPNQYLYFVSLWTETAEKQLPKSASPNCFVFLFLLLYCVMTVRLPN